MKLWAKIVLTVIYIIYPLGVVLGIIMQIIDNYDEPFELIIALFFRICCCLTVIGLVFCISDIYALWANGGSGISVGGCSNNTSTGYVSVDHGKAHHVRIIK
jgi:hypothetical protein